MAENSNSKVPSAFSISGSLRQWRREAALLHSDGFYAISVYRHNGSWKWDAKFPTPKLDLSAKDAILVIQEVVGDDGQDVVFMIGEKFFICRRHRLDGLTEPYAYHLSD